MVKEKTGMGQTLIILGLYAFSLAILFSGVFFSAYSLINDITFSVLSNNISGCVFGIMVFYLGLRGFLNVMNFHEDVKNSNAIFSWSNFKKKKVKKI